MLQMRLSPLLGEKMKITRFATSFALFIGAIACTTERALAPIAHATAVANSVAQGAPQVPLLFVVDGKRLNRDQVPTLSADQVAAVKVIKGHAALERYGQDGAYGVVIITTKQALSPNS
jgi:hypothetical protein